MSNTSNPPNRQTPTENSAKPTKPKKPIAPMQQRLMLTWLVWLIYRLLGLPILISIFNPMNPDIIGGIAWQALWLVPALVLTPSILRGRSPYALLVDSMVTLVYLGASGVVLFARIYGSSWAELAVYLLDFVLIFLINTWLFLLLKRLPSMNNVEKPPRQH
ncbi:hypothetical protein SAMN04488491_0226 [Psychrobacter sp. LV10R520-6]|nr:hypothetical protein [Psychrobacter sp. LV10R520-6]SNT69168.1 hypothetical protein SAMN04488491_0226 [Psychrobacter sp. LV10R520-6]